MPTGKLAGKGKKLWEDVYQSELKGKCKGDKACAARKAWGAVQGAGWSKGKNGEWTKKANLVEFSMRIEKTSYDKTSQEMSFVAAASDTEDDLYNDNMTLELFSDFINRIENKQAVPEEFKSDFWNGGEPYVSISHYPDLNGQAAAGLVDKSWIDGKYFKSKGHFFPTELGKAAYQSVFLDTRFPLRSDAQDKVRISIAFLDYKHVHKSSGFIFERKSLDDICPECFKNMLTGNQEGRTFLKGHLIHEALTRVPVNQRTDIQATDVIERSVMTTQKEDAESIVGEELAEFLNEETKQKLKSMALITHSDAGDDDEAESEIDEMIDATEPEDYSVEKAKAKKEDESAQEDSTEQDEADDEEMPMNDKKKGKKMAKNCSEYEELRSAIVELRSMFEKTADTHPLDPAIVSLKASYDEVTRMEVDPDEKLRLIQEAYTKVGEQIVELVKPTEVTASTAQDQVIARAIADALKPVVEKMELISAQLNYRPAIVQEKTVTPMVPERRSVNPAEIVNKMNSAPNKPLSISALARKSVGLPE